MHALVRALASMVKQRHLFYFKVLLCDSFRQEEHITLTWSLSVRNSATTSLTPTPLLQQSGHGNRPFEVCRSLDGTRWTPSISGGCSFEMKIPQTIRTGKSWSLAATVFLDFRQRTERWNRCRRRPGWIPFLTLTLAWKFLQLNPCLALLD